MMGAMSMIELAEEGGVLAKGNSCPPMDHDVMHDGVEQSVQRCPDADGNKSTYR